MKRILLGIVLLVCALIAGSQKNFVLGLVGFLCFFVIGVTLIVEEMRRRK